MLNPVPKDTRFKQAALRSIARAQSEESLFEMIRHHIRTFLPKAERIEIFGVEQSNTTLILHPVLGDPHEINSQPNKQTKPILIPNLLARKLAKLLANRRLTACDPELCRKIIQTVCAKTDSDEEKQAEHGQLHIMGLGFVDQIHAALFLQVPDVNRETIWSVDEFLVTAAVVLDRLRLVPNEEDTTISQTN